MIPYPPSFFVAGGTLPPEAPCYVMRQADNELYSALEQGHFSYVLTSRQMGKSSLMQRTARRLREAGAAVVVLDLTKLGNTVTREQWYFGLLRLAGRQMGQTSEFERYWNENLHSGPLPCFFNALIDVGLTCCTGPLTLFVDEIDTVRSLPFSTDEFFAAIRQCYQERATDSRLARLTFCLLGVASPTDLIQDPYTTPFNIGRRIELNDFTPEEAAPLAQGLSSSSEASGPVQQQRRRLLEQVLYWTGGHPYLTQRLCQEVVQRQHRTGGRTDVDAVCAALFFGHRAAQTEPNLASASSLLLAEDADTTALLDLYRRVRRGRRVPDDPTSPLPRLLTLSGIARVRHGSLVVRNRIYARVFDARWIAANVPHAEWMRQQAAYRLGVLRTAAVSMLILAGMGGLTWAAIRNAGIADSNARLYRKVLIASQTQKQSADESARQAKAAEIRATQAASDRLTALNGKSAALLTAKKATTLAQTRASQVQEALMETHRQLSQAQEEHGIALLNRGEGGGMFDLLNAWKSAGDFPALQEARGRVWQGWYAAYARDLVRVVGLPENIIGFASSADGNLIALATFDHRVWIYDVAAGKLRGHPLQQPDAITLMTLSPDGTRLACGLQNQHLTLWNVATGALIRETGAAPEDRFYPGWEGPRDLSADIPPPHEWRINDMVFSPDSKRLLVANGANGGGNVDIYDPQTGARRKFSACTCSTPVCRIQVSPDSSQMMMLYGGWKSLRRVNLDALDACSVTGKITSQTFPEEPFSIDAKLTFSYSAFSPDSRQFVAWDDQNRSYVLDMTGHRNIPVKTLEQPDAVREAIWAPNSGLLVTSCRNGDVLFWDSETWSRKSPLFHVSDRVGAMAFTPDGSQLAIAMGNELLRCDTHPGGPVRASLLPFGIDRPHFLSRSGMLACYTGRTLHLYRATPAENLLCLAWGHVTSATLSPNGDRVVTALDDSTVQVWDSATGHPIGPPLRHKDQVGEAFFTRDGRHVVTRASRHLALWDAATGKRLWDAPEQPDPIYSVGLSPDGKHLVTASGNKEVHCTVQQWETATGRPIGPAIHQREMAYDMDYSPDGTVLAVEDGPVVRLWTSATMQSTGRMFPHDGDVRSIRFAPDGKRLLTASEDGSARLWDVATGRQITLSMIHQGHVLGALFSPDGSRIATGSADKTVRLWDTRTGAPLGVPLQASGPISGIVFRPDGKTLAIGAEQSIQLWDVETCQPIGPPMPQGATVTGLAFHPDGRRILVVSPGMAARLIPLPSDPLPTPTDMSQETQRVLGIHRDQGRQSRLLSPH